MPGRLFFQALKIVITLLVRICLKLIGQINIFSVNSHFIKDKLPRLFGNWFFVGLIILFVVFVRVRLLEVPLERDEGEYAYMGQLILQGVPPYSEAYNMKFPGTYLMYALIMTVFGQTTKGIHMGFMIVNCITILLVYLLCRKITGDFAALMASGAYAVLSLSSSVYGFAAHATHFVVLFALGGALALLHASTKEKPSLYFLSGILAGISFIMKQPGIFFSLFFAAHIVIMHFVSRPSPPIRQLFIKLGALSAGASLPLLITLLWLYLSGVFDRFWFWTVVYASRYGSQVPLSQVFSTFTPMFTYVVDGFFILWALAGLGIIATFFHKELKENRAFILLFALFSFFSICPGFFFRQHYFVTLLPAVSLLAGVFVDFVGSRGFGPLRPPLTKIAGSGIVAVALLVGILGQNGYLFRESPEKVSRTSYGPNPFPESVQIAEFIKSRSGGEDKIAVIGSEPQIYFYTGRHSATGYIYTYSLMEDHEYALTMQKEMAQEIKSASPKFIVLVSVYTSWLQQPNSEKYIFEWSDNYIRENYVLVGVADILSPEKTIYRWDADARNYLVLSQWNLLIFERADRNR